MTDQQDRLGNNVSPENGAEQLASHAEAVQKANRELEAFTYTVAHDLRAPLRLIQRFAHLLLQDGLEPARQTEYAELIGEAARQMAAMMEDLLEFSRMARQPLRRHPIDMAALAREVAHALCSTDDYENAEVMVGAAPVCDADPALLRCVFSNLIGNALKFSRTQAAPRVEVGAETRDGETVYHVRDNGVGFDPAQHDRLFQVFKRLHAPEDFEGSGVGLAIVSRIIARHGGKVWAESAPGAGATFFFTVGASGGDPELETD